MIHRISDAINVTEEDLEGEGAFNGFVEIDSRLHVDPHLLKTVTTLELKDSYKHFRQYFDEVIHLLDASSFYSDRFYRQAVQRLIFHEVPIAALGYSTKGILGSGIGIGFAKEIAKTASEIVAAGIKDPIIFELVGLLEEGIGADRISDMTIRIILGDLLQYSQRVAKNLKVETRIYKYRGIKYAIPYDSITKRKILLFPKEILCDLPIAIDKDDVDFVSFYNSQLRKEVNKIIGITWKEAAKIKKQNLRGVLLKSPEFLRNLIKRYRSKSITHYDFINDPLGKFNWYVIAQKFSKEYPIDIKAVSYEKLENIVELVILICEQFKRLVEKNGLWKTLYDTGGRLQHERYAQLLFFAIADAYCEANNLDLSREPNEGRGSVDFKISSGYKFKIIVEIKYSRNTHLRKGYTKQLPAYQQAERTEHSIYMIIRTTRSTKIIDKLSSIRDQGLKEGRSMPDIIIVEGRRELTASKL